MCVVYAMDANSQKQFQATPPPASVKAVEEICVTCGGAHPYYQCLATDGNTFRDNIQGYVSVAAVNYNQASICICVQPMSIKEHDDKTFSQMTSFYLGTRPSVPMPHPSLSPEVGMIRVEETLLTDPKLAEYTIKIPTGKLFDSCTSKVDSEPPRGSNVDISNTHECKQTLDESAGTSINVQKEQILSLSAELESLFGPLFDEYFNGENQVVSKSFAVTTADASDKRQQQPDSTSSTSTLATTVTADGNFDL
ncbi:hypothetical protein Tco_0572465 [Tanacetum coccineum]